MHSSAQRHRRAPAGATGTQTKGLVLAGGVRYDLHTWLMDAFIFRGQGRKLRQRVLKLAGLQPGEHALDVGCGTGTLAIEAARRVGSMGRVVGIDPGTEQVARAREKAVRRRVPVEFEIGVIEQLAFLDATFDVVLSTLMFHHLPAPLKRQGIAEIARVLKPGGRLVIADFTRPRERKGLAARFHAGGSSEQEVTALVADAGFAQIETEQLPSRRFSAFPGASLIRARKM